MSAATAEIALGHSAWRVIEHTTIGQTLMLSSILALLLALVPSDSTATPSDLMVAQLMQSVHSYTDPFDGPAEDVQLRTEWADLTGDGVQDALVYLDSPTWCGSGGCTVLVFEGVVGEDADELGPFRIAAEISMMHGPVTVATTSHDGWKDLIVVKESGQSVALRFDGETYPQSPGAGVDVASVDAGVVLFADAQ